MNVFIRFCFHLINQVKSGLYHLICPFWLAFLFSSLPSKYCLFQKLFPDMLNLLKIRQAEVRYMPLHHHARSVVIPEFLDGQNLYVYCRLPEYFTRNMKKLKLDFKKFL